MHLSDKELLRAFRSDSSLKHFEPFLDRYLAFVYAAACRQLPDEAAARQATHAVFLAYARRARRLARRTVVADWLYSAVRLTARKLRRTPRKSPIQPSTGQISSSPIAV